MARKRLNISKAIKRPGALRAKAVKAGAIDDKGNISQSWIKSQAKGSDLTARQARFAIVLKNIRK